MADLETQDIVDAGTVPTYVTPSASDTAEVGNGRNTFLHVKNASAGAVVATITVPGNTDYGQPTPDPEITVAAGSEGWIPLRKVYDQADGTGRAVVAIAPTTDVTVAAVRLG